MNRKVCVKWDLNISALEDKINQIEKAVKSFKSLTAFFLSKICHLQKKF
jgi:hypothetical protein